MLAELESRESWMAGASFQKAVLLMSVSKWDEAAAAAAAAAATTSNGGSELQEPARLLLGLIRLCGGNETQGSPSTNAIIQTLIKSFASNVSSLAPPSLY